MRPGMKFSDASVLLFCRRDDQPNTDLFLPPIPTPSRRILAAVLRTAATIPVLVLYCLRKTLQVGNVIKRK